MGQNTRAAKRGVELPFTTVEDGLAFGRKKVEEFIRERQEEQLKQMQSQQRPLDQTKTYTPEGNQVAGFANPFLDLEELGPLNFNQFLEEYQSELERNMEQVDAADLQGILKTQGDDLDREKTDDFDLDLESDNDSLDENDIDDDKTRGKGSRKKSSKSKSKSRSDKQSKKKTINASRNQQRNNRDKAASLDKRVSKVVSLTQQQQQKDAQQRTRKVIESRNTEVIAKDSRNGQNITRQTEKVKDQAVGVDGRSAQSKPEAVKTPQAKPNAIVNKLAEAKLAIQVEGMIQGAALVTHQTGRPTEFQVGKDVLKFERQGEDTFALKNGEKIPLEDAQNMLKTLGRSIGPKAMDQMAQIVKVAQQNPTIRTLSQNKEEKTTEKTQEQQTKVIKVQSSR